MHGERMVSEAEWHCGCQRRCLRRSSSSSPPPWGREKGLEPITVVGLNRLFPAPTVRVMTAAEGPVADGTTLDGNQAES